MEGLALTIPDIDNAVVHEIIAHIHSVKDSQAEVVGTISSSDGGDASVRVYHFFVGHIIRVLTLDYNLVSWEKLLRRE